MYAIRSYYAWLIMQPKAVHLLLDKVSEMFVNALDYFADRITSYNVCYTKLLRPGLC